MRVTEIAVRNGPAIPPSATLQEAGDAMGKADTGVLPVVEGGQLVGTLSERDLAVAGCGGGLDPRSVTVSRVFERTPVACPGHADLRLALEQMRDRRQTWLVVLDPGGKPTGVVSLTALLDVLADLVPEDTDGPELESVRRVRGEDLGGGPAG